MCLWANACLGAVDRIASAGMRKRRARLDAPGVEQVGRDAEMDRRLAEIEQLEFGTHPLPPEPRNRAVLTLVLVSLAVAGLLSVWLLGGSDSRHATAGDSGLRVA